MIGPSQMPEVQPLLINPNVPIDHSNTIPSVMVPSQDWNYNRLANAPPMDPVVIDPPLVQGVNNNSSATNMFIEQWRMPNPWVDPSLLLNPNMPDPYPNLVSQSTSDLTMEENELKRKRNGRSGKDMAKNLEKNIINNEEVQYNINDSNDNILSLINYIDTQDFDSLTFDEIQNIFDTNNINDILTNDTLLDIFLKQDSIQGCTPSSSSNPNGPKPKPKAKPSESKNKLARLKSNRNGDSSDSSSFIASVPSLTNNSNATTTESSSDPNSGKESSKSGSPSNKEDQSNSSNDEKQEDQASTQSNSNDMEEEKASDQESQLDAHPKKRGKRGRPMQLKCPTCKKIFTRPSSFQTHQLSHSGEKPFPCPVPGCDKRFSVPSNQRRHLKVHKKRLERLKNEDIPFDHGTELLELYFSGAYPQIFDEEPILVRSGPNLLGSRQNSLTSSFPNIPYDSTRAIPIIGGIGESSIMTANPSTLEDSTISHIPSSPNHIS
jgi:hypothetical protein